MLQREQHSLDGALVTVALSRNATVGIPDEEKMEESRTIEVTGLASTTTKDAIIHFFENNRRSGGGEISDVEIVTEKGCAVVTFLLAESEWEWQSKRQHANLPWILSRLFSSVCSLLCVITITAYQKKSHLTKSLCSQTHSPKHFILSPLPLHQKSEKDPIIIPFCMSLPL